jgi:hypothetical protein
MQRTYLIIVVLLVFFVGCNKTTKKQKNANDSIVSNDTIIDTLPLQSFQSIDLENEEQNICFDTLKIVSGNYNLLYYPFGIHDNIEEFLSSLPKEMVVEKQIKMNRIEIYHILFGNNNIEFFFGDDYYYGKDNFAIKIINAEIKDDTIEIVNCIKTGMTKQTFIEMLNLTNTKDLKKIRVVELISILEGIWQYYTFNESDILTKIEINSDYVFE